MSRKRLSWMQKTADPYTMNQDHDQPGHDKYLIGDPSAFAEEPMQDLPDDEALGRNEIGLPNMSEYNLTHKDVDDWNSGEPYDNAGTFSPADKDRTAAMQREAARDVYARLEKKAYQCVKIASALLPGAPDSLVEEQAFDLMSLPDEVVISTVIRLAADDEEEDEMEEEEKESSLRMSEDDEDMDEEEDEKDEDKKEKKEASFDDERIEAMLREMLAEEDEDDDDDEDDDEDEDMEDDEKESSFRLSEDDEEEDDEEIEAMIRDMMEHEGMEHAEAMGHDGMKSHGMGMDHDMDIQLEPQMDVVSSDIEQNDEVLKNLFANTVPEQPETQAPANNREASRKQTENRGVQTLGGRVKEAADGGEDFDLSKIWKHDPDISDMF